MILATKIPSTEVEVEGIEVEEVEVGVLLIERIEPVVDFRSLRTPSQLSKLEGGGKIWTSKSNIQSNYCNKYGHYERECRKKQADHNNGRSNVSK